MSILIVDDDAAIRDSLSAALELHGFRVAVAGNGMDALCAMDRLRPALVLLDLWMPVLDGAGFARALAKRGRHVPLLLMSADPQGAQLARQIGAAMFLEKPFELSDLLAGVKRLLAEQHHSRRNAA